MIMNVELTIAIANLMLSALTAYIILPYIVGFSLNKGYKNTTVNHGITGDVKSCRIGGLALSFSMALSLFVSCMLCHIIWSLGYINMKSYIDEAVVLLILSVVVFYDDIKGLGYKYKLVSQIVAGLIIIYSGTYISNLHGLFGIYELPTSVAVALTLFTILLITNAINFIDGLDGMASMITGIALLMGGGLFFISDIMSSALIAFAMAGSLIVFIFYNIFGTKRFPGVKIMMGDCGSLVLGLLLSLMVIKLWKLSETIIDKTLINYTQTLALTVVFIPCIDAVTTILNRIKNKKSIFMPDNNHIHHKLLSAGNSQHKVLRIITFINCGYIVFNLLLTNQIGLSYIILLDVAIWIIFNQLIYKKIKHVL